jgi:glucose/arabinose dehydrogenase
MGEIVGTRFASRNLSMPNVPEGEIMPPRTTTPGSVFESQAFNRSPVKHRGAFPVLNRRQCLRIGVVATTLLMAGCGQANTPTAVPASTTASATSRPRPTTVASASGAVATSVPSRPTEVPPPATAASAATPAIGDAGRVTLATEVVARDLRQPLFVTHAGDGTNRLFVAERAGRIRHLPDGQIFLDITDRVGSAGLEQGLLGLAFHPRFRENGHFYVNYTNRGGDTVIARFGLDTAQRGAPESEHPVLRQDQPAANHNGGMLAFGPDGYLYAGLGDGGGANDRFENGQNRQSLLGTIVRIDVDQGDPYAIPPDNPFVGDAGARPEIWAYGLRNPWRFSFDRVTGDLYIADVGQNQREWVHLQPAGSPGGQNYGWPIVEGSRCMSGADCNREGLTPPIAEYARASGCAITGGYVYRGSRSPVLVGNYVFGDYCSGRIWTLARNQAGEWIATEKIQMDARISSFGEDESGEVYLTDLAGGTVHRLTARPR